MHRGVLAVTVVGLCSPALLGCSSDTPQADPTSSPHTSSVSPTSPPATPPPTTPSSPQEPTIPALARQESLAGAKAFVEVFATKMNTAWTTTETRALSTLFAPTCASCEDITAGIDSIGTHDGRTQGAIWSITALSPIPLQPKTKPIIHAAIRTSAGRWKPSADAKWRSIPTSTTQWDVHLAWTQRGWLIQEAISQ